MKRAIKTSLLCLCGLLLSLTNLAQASARPAERVHLDLSLGQPVLLANQTQTNILKVGLTGFEIRRKADRPAANVAIVLDRSGSMKGKKLEHARMAARIAVEKLRPDDILSVVIYDDSVQVIVPATKLHDRASVLRAIDGIRAGGSTALFAGVSKGAAELRKFLERERVNRVVLLSDGLANVGPDSPAELGRLGASLGREGIAVSTIGLGLGYNEDLMVELANYSDGNHAFVEDPEQLVSIFNREFGDVTSVVAQDVEIIIDCADNIRPIRVLGRDAEIIGQRIRLRLNQLYAAQEKYLLVEVEIPPGKVGQSREIASVDINYANMIHKRQERLQDKVSVSFTPSPAAVTTNQDEAVLTRAAEQQANLMNKKALRLRDAGQREEAKAKLEASASYLRQQAERYDAPELREMEAETLKDADEVEAEDWRGARKAMRAKQHKRDNQQSY